MIISKILKPKSKLSQTAIDFYFKGSGYESEEDNVIEGCPWVLYLTDEDYKEYISQPQSDVVRKSLKKQIKEILYNH
jgi:hypothetical protein